MSETTTETVIRRPKSITIICVISFIGAIFLTPFIFSTLAKSVGLWYPPFLGATTLFGLVAMVGLWMMKRWALYLYISVVVISQIVLYLMGVWTVLDAIAPSLALFYILKHYAKMK